VGNQTVETIHFWLKFRALRAQSHKLSRKVLVDYYYAVAGQQSGPIPEEQLDQMIANGSLAPETLIWAQGMEGWVPYSQVRSAPSTPPTGATVPPSVGQVVCTVCKQVFAPDQVIQYGGAYVCGSCKPHFLQSLREGAQPVAALRYGGFWRRLVAKILDVIVVQAISYAGGFVIGLSLRGQDIAAPLIGGIFGFVVGFGYPIFFLGKYGQTLGKMALKLKVVTPDGAPISYSRAAGRSLAEMLNGCTLGIGYLIAAFDDQRRGLHDRLAGTRVIDISNP
jgi:uncharacterized RDD family membrane protein YckC